MFSFSDLIAIFCCAQDIKINDIKNNAAEEAIYRENRPGTFITMIWR